MFSTLRNRFGIPGVISVIALVFAMIGGAYAASNSGDGNNATASAKKKAAKGPRGPKGATGPTGPAGPAGAQGPKGDAGPKGDTGAPGVDGKDGAAGSKGATGAEGPEGEPGVPGVEGPKGQPWTPDNTLPVKATETGTFAAFTRKLGAFMTSISFTIPLAAELDETKVQANPLGFPLPESTTTEKENCPGSASDPKAKSGFLCVYTAAAKGLFPPFVKGRASIQKPTTVELSADPGAGKSGATLFFFTQGYEEAGFVEAGEVVGTFAVTG